MTKRTHDDSSRAYPPDASNGLLPINDLLSPSDDRDDDHAAGAIKRPRNFIASVACENCRVKKTRCDESRPKCGLCKSLGLDCIYNERKSSKRDQSLTLIMSTLHRLETKLEHLPSTLSREMQPALRGHMLQTIQGWKDSGLPAHNRSGSSSSSTANKPVITAPAHTPDMGPPDDFEFDRDPTSTDASGQGHVSISFSQHGVILWPGAREVLPKRLLEAHEHLGKNYVIDLEMKRPPLPMYICPFPPPAGEGWLETLPLALVKGLSDAFFATFNPFTPIMDKNFFFAFTLGTAIENAFGYTMETCLVLNVLALGCLAVRTHQEGNYPLPDSQSGEFDAPEWISVIHEEPPGLRFFNEARRRIGFLMCDNDLQSCQFYLLSSVYYSQILRPMDSWAMIHRAATCCLSMLTNHDDDVNFDEWEGDMKSRVYWNCLMNETILVQELHLPPSGLARLEEFVPIPKFIPFETAGFVSVSLFSFSSDGGIDDSFFQYHFLAQVAHRIILTRIRHSFDSGTFPLPAVNAELHHQLEQWRSNLPPALQFPDALLESDPTTSKTDTNDGNDNANININDNDNINTKPLTPATAITTAMLLGRYKIAKFHIGRPYLYKALRIPDSLSSHDIEQVRSGLQNAMDWPVVEGVFREMKSCVPIRFAFCSQFFGQILLFYCIAHSASPTLRACLPPGWERWNDKMWRFLEDCAEGSPAVEQDVQLLRLLL